MLNWTVYEKSLDIESLKFTPLRHRFESLFSIIYRILMICFLSRRVVVSSFSMYENRFMEAGLTVNCATAASVSHINVSDNVFCLVPSL